MPVGAHPSVSAPQDENIPVWRYINFPKFVSLLESKALWFARSDKLGDPFEGSVPQKDVAIRDSRLDTFPPEVRVKANGPFRKYVGIESWMRVIEARWMYVNSWHISEHESAALWQLYSGEAGLAMKSTYAQLCDSIVSELTIYVGEVSYLDYRSDSLADPDQPLVGADQFKVFMSKRKSFEHERELRAVHAHEWPTPHGGGPKIPRDLLEAGGAVGIQVPVNIGTLISDVRVSPYAPPWLSQLTKQVVLRHGYEISVFQSDLRSDPVY